MDYIESTAPLPVPIDTEQRKSSAENAALSSGSHDQNPEVCVRTNLIETHSETRTAPNTPAQNLRSSTVTILPIREALFSSRMAPLLQPQLPPYELSFWTDASMPGSKLRQRLKSVPESARGIVRFCVVHRRWDVKTPKPGDPLWNSTWWLSGYVATNVFSTWQAEAMGVVKALEMALKHCEQVSGVILTADGHKPCKTRIDAPMPLVVNVFGDNVRVLRSLGGFTALLDFPHNQWLILAAKDLVTNLSRYGVRVNFQHVPGHAGDLLNEWADKGTRIPLQSLVPLPNGTKRQVCRVMLVPRRYKRDLKCSSLILVDRDIPKENKKTTDLEQTMESRTRDIPNSIKEPKLIMIGYPPYPT